MIAYLATLTDDHTAVLAAKQRLCELAPATCRDLAAELGGDAARDAYERYLQYHSLENRLEAGLPLLRGYQRGEFPEPVPGRAAALERWLRQQKIDI